MSGFTAPHGDINGYPRRVVYTSPFLQHEPIHDIPGECKPPGAKRRRHTPEQDVK